MPTTPDPEPLAGPALEWMTVEVDWPIDVLRLQVEVVNPRELTALEWVVERILLDFGNDAPTVEEATEMLALHEPEFVRRTVETLEELGAVERNDLEVDDALRAAALTERGRELFGRGQVEGRPATHGMVVHIDAVTGEQFKKAPARLEAGATRPLQENLERFEPPEAIGAEQARQWATRQKEGFARGDYRIRGVRVDGAESRRAWAKVELKLSITADARVVVEAPGARKAQRRWVASEALNVRELLDSLGVRVEVPRPGAGATRALAEAASLLSPTAYETAAACLAGEAERELVLHGAAMDLDPVRRAVEAAARGGVKVFVVGGDPEVARAGRHGGFVAAGRPDAREVPVAVVADGRQAVRREVVALQVAGGGVANRRLAADLAWVVAGEGVAEVRGAMTDGLADSLQEAGPVGIVAALFVSADPACWQRAVDAACSGQDRVGVIELLAELGAMVQGSHVEEATGGDPLAPARDAWWAAVDDLGSSDDAGSERLALVRLATGLVDPAEATEALLLELSPAASALADPRGGASLARLSRSIRAEWKGWQPRRCEEFARLAEAVLSVPPAADASDWSPERVAEAAATVLELASRARAVTWLEAVMGAWRPEPGEGALADLLAVRSALLQAGAGGAAAADRGFWRPVVHRAVGLVEGDDHGGQTDNKARELLGAVVGDDQERADWERALGLKPRSRRKTRKRNRKGRGPEGR